MKKLKKIVSTLLAVAICVLLPNVNALTVSAEEPVTYCVKYSDNDDDWRYILGSKWDDEANDRELYYMLQEIKDGDKIVVAGGKEGKPLEVPVHLSNVTILPDVTAIVSAKSITDCYVLNNAVSAINGDVTNAYVYEHGCCCFNNNVDTLQILTDSTRDYLLYANVTVVGTVNHLIGKDSNQVHYEFYNFQAGKLEIVDGDLETDEKFYSNTPSAASTTQAPATATQTQASASGDEYDDVPKTGDSTLVFWLIGISVICFAGRYTLKKA